MSSLCVHRATADLYFKCFLWDCHNAQEIWIYVYVSYDPVGPKKVVHFTFFCSIQKQCFTFEKPRRAIHRSHKGEIIWGSDLYFFCIHQVAVYVIRLAAPLCNSVKLLALQSDLFDYAVTYLAPRKHMDRVCTSKRIIYYVSHRISVMNVLGSSTWSGDGSDYRS